MTEAELKLLVENLKAQLDLAFEGRGFTAGYINLARNLAAEAEAALDAGLVPEE